MPYAYAIDDPFLTYYKTHWMLLNNEKWSGSTFNCGINERTLRIPVRLSVPNNFINRNNYYYRHWNNHECVVLLCLCIRICIDCCLNFWSTVTKTQRLTIDDWRLIMHLIELVQFWNILWVFFRAQRCDYAE